MQHFRYSINQSMFYFMSVHIEVILDNNQKIIIFYTNLPTGLCTINLTIEIKISVLYKMSLTLLQSLKSYPFFWNKSVVTAHSNSMCLTNRIFLQTHVTFCECSVSVNSSNAHYVISSHPSPYRSPHWPVSVGEELEVAVGGRHDEEEEQWIQQNVARKCAGAGVWNQGDSGVCVWCAGIPAKGSSTWSVGFCLSCSTSCQKKISL